MVRTTQVSPKLSGIVPTQDPQHTRASCVLLRDLAVEWTGSYSVDKTLALFAYTESCSPLKTLLWLLLMPLAAVVSPLLIELLHLNDPLLGWHANSMFFVRTAIRGTAISFCIDSQSELYIPEQKQPLASLLLMNCVQGAIMAGATAAIAAIAGVFPVPFVAAAAAPIYAALSWVVRSVFIRVMLPAETDPVRINRIKRRLPQVMRLVTFGLMLVYIYNAFAAVFSQVPEHYRVALTVLLQVIKVGATRRQWKLSHIGEDHGQNELEVSEDLATAHVASGARFFHSLFTATCLQKSKSYLTLVFVVGFAFAQDVATVRALTDLEHNVAHATEALTRTNSKSSIDTQHRGFQETLQCIAERVRMMHVDTSSPQQTHVGMALARDKSFYIFRQQADAAISTHAVTSSTQCSHRLTKQPPTPHETAFLLSAARLLHCREAALLRLYMEIFVPLVYFAYIALVQYSPNIAYLPALQDSDLSSLASRLAIQAAVKIMAVVFILRRHCRESGGLKQLAFALSSMRTVVLANSLKSALGVFDFPLLHNGHDFSFQFKWLHGRN